MASKAESFSTLILCLVLTLSTGCVSVAPPSERLSALQTEEQKNYTLNQPLAVNVGEPLVLRRSYHFKVSEREDRAKASANFKLTTQVPLGKDLVTLGRKDEELLVVGSTVISKKKYLVVKTGDIAGYSYGALVDSETGRVSKTGTGQNAFGSWVTGGITTKVEPEDLVLTLSKSVEVDKSKPYENFEIIYTGRLGENITLLYREFTPDNLARPAFFQNLTYNLSENRIIRFRKLQIEIKEASNESLRAMVLAD